MKYGCHPYPENKSFKSFKLILPNTVGLDILNPFKCNIGNTTPSVTGLINLFICHPVDNGPVSASPSPTIQVHIKSGLSNTAPNE